MCGKKEEKIVKTSVKAASLVMVLMALAISSGFAQEPK
jgi:hypothetical protein